MCGALPHAVRAVVGDASGRAACARRSSRASGARTRGCRRCGRAPTPGTRSALPCVGGEVHLVLEPVRLGTLVVERLAGRLVVGVHPDDVDDVVARVALRSRGWRPCLGSGAKSNRNSCPGTDRIAVTMRCQYVFQASGSGPQRWVYVVPFISQPSTITVSGAFRRDQPLGQRAEVVVEPARARPRAAGRAPRRRGRRSSLRSSIGTLRTNSRSLLRLPPLAPRLQEARLPLDVRPQVAGQIGVTDPQLRAAEPGSDSCVDAPARRRRRSAGTLRRAEGGGQMAPERLGRSARWGGRRRAPRFG